MNVFGSMEETHSGNMMAESKKEAMEALRDTAVDDGLSTVRLNNSKYSNQILYKYFDSVAEAERELFGKRHQIDIHVITVGLLLRIGEYIQAIPIIARKSGLRQTKKPPIYCLIFILMTSTQYMFWKLYATMERNSGMLG